MGLLVGLLASFALPGHAQVNSTENNALTFQVGGTEYARISDTLGKVGIGTTDPIAKLTVSGNISSTGVIQVSGSSLTCSSAIKGSIRYSNTSSTVEYCNSTAWTSLGPSDTTPISFRVHKNGTNQTVTTLTSTKLTWSTEQFDTNNNFASDRFTASVAGKYLLHFQPYCNGAGYCIASIYKNGSPASQNAIYNTSGANPGNVMAIVDMSVGDYVESYVYSTNTSISGNSADTYFEGVLLGPQAGGGGATPAGSTADVQYNSAGALAADTGNFTYASGLLTAPRISGTTSVNGRFISGTQVFGSTVSGSAINAATTSFTTIYNPGTFSGNEVAVNSLTSSLVSTTNASATDIQIGAGGSCASVLRGKIRYNATSDTLQICANGGGCTSLVSSTGLSGHIPYWSGASAISYDTNQLFWDASNNRLGVGTSVPSTSLQVMGAVRFGSTPLSTGSVGTDSMVWGTRNVGAALGSTVAGSGSTVASGSDYGMAFGISNTINSSSGYANMAWGGNNKITNAIGYYNTVWGENNQSNGAIVYGVTIWGKANTATTAQSEYATIWGTSNTITAAYSTAWGISNTVGDDYVTMWGEKNKTSGLSAEYSTAWGSQNTVKGNYATAWGVSNTATSYAETVLGQFAENDNGNASTFGGGDRVLQVGIGSSSAARANALTILKSGEVGIGTATPTTILHVYSSTAGAAVIKAQNGTGTCTYTPAASGTGTWSCSSDARLKKDIVNTETKALDYYNDMRIRDYSMKTDGSRQTGVIAQELLETHPEMVHVGSDGFYTVDEPNKWLLVKALQELKAVNDNLAARNAMLEKRIETIERAMVH